jgi:hypothetical protein
MNNEAPDALVSLQRLWNDHRMSHSINWNLFQSYHLMFVEEGTELVVWNHMPNGPQVVQVAKVTKVGLSFHSGLLIGLTDAAGAYYTVKAYPREALPGVFLWTPAFSDVRFAPRKFADPDSPRVLSLALCAKMRSRFDRPVEGHRYVSTMKEFRAVWPTTPIL